MLRTPTESVVVLADRGKYQPCPALAVAGYITVAQGIGWDLTSGLLFPSFGVDRSRGLSPLPPPRLTASLQSHLREAGLTVHYTMHSFRVGGSVSESLTGTAVDEIMKLGGWKTGSVVEN